MQSYRRHALPPSNSATTARPIDRSVHYKFYNQRPPPRLHGVARYTGHGVGRGRSTGEQGRGAPRLAGGDKAFGRATPARTYTFHHTDPSPKALQYLSRHQLATFTLYFTLFVRELPRLSYPAILCLGLRLLSSPRTRMCKHNMHASAFTQEA